MSKIIQILLTDENNKWQGRLLGLGDDGVTYSVDNTGFWELFVPPLENNKEINQEKSTTSKDDA